MIYLTASLIYNYLQCQHRVWRDIYGPQEEKIKEANPFVQLLWEKGVLHEIDVIKDIGQFLDLSGGNIVTRLTKTFEALKQGIPLIYHGLIQFGNLRGEPDLLRKNDDGTYTPIDIKSGRGFENVSENSEEKEKYKKHYAAQLALYLEILENIGFSKKRLGIIYDIDNKEVIYDLNLPMGVKNKQTWWECYQQFKDEAILLLENKRQNTPAIIGMCKLCPWYASCKKWCLDKHDLSMIFALGRSKRETLLEDAGAEKADELVDMDISALLQLKAKDKTFLRGFADKSLQSIKKRATVLMQTKHPVVYQPFQFPLKTYELFFDIEDDPTQGFVYLHGVYERTPKSTLFIPFVAKDVTPDAEKTAWKEFWAYIRSLPKDDFCLYYYSKHEKTTYKKLQEQYPDVATTEDIEWLFDPLLAVDLYYDVVLKYTDWPLHSYSLKDIAKYLKFDWRDKTPSGALSIQWFNEYLEDKDPMMLQRIIEYNEDDCKAMMVIKDYLTQTPNSI